MTQCLLVTRESYSTTHVGSGIRIENRQAVHIRRTLKPLRLEKSTLQ